MIQIEFKRDRESFSVSGICKTGRILLTRGLAVIFGRRLGKKKTQLVSKKSHKIESKIS